MTADASSTTPAATTDSRRSRGRRYDGREWALIARVVFSGLWSGLLAMLTLILHPMLRQMEGPEFARFLRGFLPTARHAPFNYIAILGMVVPAGWEALRTRYFAFQCPMERYSNPEVRQAVERLHQHLR